MRECDVESVRTQKKKIAIRRIGIVGDRTRSRGWLAKKKCSFFSLGLTCYFLSLSDMLDGCDGNDDCDDIKRKREREKRACSNNRSRSGDDDG
jgi:hypothetical protein